MQMCLNQFIQFLFRSTFKLPRIKIIFVFLILHCSVLHSVPISDKRVDGVIIANILHVRAKPGVKYEVVGRLLHGDTVEIVNEMGEWVGIVAPPETVAWISQNTVDNNGVTIERVNVYSGPGSIFSRFAVIEKGKKVNVRNLNDEKWAKISPLDDFVVWIHRDYVSRNSSSNSLGNGHQHGAESAVSEKDNIDDPTGKIEQSEDYIEEIGRSSNTPNQISSDLLFLSNGLQVKKSGVVIPISNKYHPLKYGLALRVNSIYYPLVYLHLEHGQLQDFAWNEINVTGTQRWAKGFPRPIIEIDHLALVQESSN